MDPSSSPIPASDAQHELAALAARIDAILPPQYAGCFEDVPPQSMGSATLKYDEHGQVAWGEIWTTFCHLALAGGPPHRGRLLAAVATSEALAHPAEQAAVVAEIKRAIRLTSDLPPTPEQPPGRVGILCDDADMASWLVRAIVAENVIARSEANVLFVPAGPHFRVEKEIKNVVVCVAKTCHYLLDHVDPKARPRGLARLIQPALPDEIAASPEQHRLAAEALCDQLSLRTGLNTVAAESAGWIGIECASEEMAVWMLRAIVVESILARREGCLLFVPACTADRSSADADQLQRVVAQAHRLWLLHSANVQA